ncbi:unnamed protein product [Urochloa decumbens]|uniref:Amine oxidase domain-containing protein n=1 Tax=Urochloa decumbens TaxID=240449 RepID=A0ABC8WVS5_9POAL
MKAKVIIIGAGMSGISAGKQLSDAGITDLLILEATDRIGGRIRKTEFAGMNIEMGANWVEGVAHEGEARNDDVNPIWSIVNNELGLTTFCSNYDNIASNTYNEDGTGLYDEDFVKRTIDEANEVQKKGNKISERPRSDDISVMAMQRFFEHTPYGPTKPVDMVIDYYMNDYEFAEPPRVTSVQSTHPLPTFVKFGKNVYFVADQRGYESVVHYITGQYLETDGLGAIVDPKLMLNKAVQEITYSQDCVTVKTEDGWLYEAEYVMVSVSLGVLQSNLITFSPPLPHLEKEYPGCSILLVTITDEESRRIEQQSDEQTKAEAMEVLRKMFPDRDVPDATDIFVPRWWSDKFFRGSFSNWPIGVDSYEYDQIRKPVGRVHFTGEHTSEHYNGYVHGAYLAGKHSADILIDHAKREK